jgi:hypothetical protein
MAVNLIWSLTNGGAAISDPLDHGSGNAGDTLSSQTIFLEHDGDNQLTGCGFYLSEKSDPYTGGFSAAADLTEIIGWGDETTADDFGGFQINMDAAGGFPGGSWPTYSSKQPTNGSAFYTGIGDSADNKILLATAMGISSPGVIPAGTSPDISFQARFVLPTNEGTTGFREVNQAMRFTFTS